MQLVNVEKLLKGAKPLGEIPENRELLTTTLHVAWPSILESFLLSLVGLIDTAMVSTLGSYAIAAVGLTTQPKFIGLAIFISLNVAVSAIVARRCGENDAENANKVLVQALIITVLFTAIVSLVCVVFADQIIRFAGSEADTHPYSVTYFRIIMGGMIFNTISLVINAAQRGAGNTKVAMRTNMVSNAVNVVFNYLLIGGNFGFPRLGVKGAAIATVIGSVFACIMSVRSVLHQGRFLCLRHVTSVRFDKKTLGTIANIGSSTLAEQVFLRGGFLIYAIIVAHLGTTAFAAHQIGMNMMTISFSFGDGLSVAAIALVGQNLGAKREDLARIYGTICHRIGTLFSCLICVTFVVFGRYFFLIFSQEEPILAYGEMIMSLLAVITFLQISQVVYSGCLRGAGDTVYTAFVSLVSVAIIRPGLGYLFCYPLGMGLFGAWLGLSIDQFMRFLLTYLRFKGGKWTKRKI